MAEIEGLEWITKMPEEDSGDALFGAEVKAYDPNQKRGEAGTPQGGRWVKEDGTSSESEASDAVETALDDLATLDLDDDQINIPEYNPEKDNFADTINPGIHGIHLHVKGKDEIEDFGAHEIHLLDNDDESIGFVRLTKSDKEISINLIAINEDRRGEGIASDFYQHFLNEGYDIKSDKEITDGTAGLYKSLIKKGVDAEVDDDGRVILKRKKP